MRDRDVERQEVQSKKALDRLSQQIEYFTVLTGNVTNRDSQFRSAVETLEELREEIRRANEHGLGEAGTSMSLLKRLILDTKVKLQVMAEDSRLTNTEVSSHTINNNISTNQTTSNQSASNSNQLPPRPVIPAPSSATSNLTANMHLTGNSSERPCDDGPRAESGNSDKESTCSSTTAAAPKLSQNGDGTGDKVSPSTSDKTSPAADKTNEAGPSSKQDSHTGVNGEVKIMRPPSPIPGPSSKPDFIVESDKVGANVATRLRLENERLKREVSELRKLVSASGVTIPSTLIATATNGSDVHSEEDLVTRVQSLEEQLVQAKETISAMKADRKKLKAEKCDLVNQMKQLYATLEDKEKELRDFIRSFEQVNKMRDQDDCLNQERADRERERWSLLKQARDEAERSLSLAAQLDLKQQQLLDARRALSSGGCLSDQESASGWRGVNGGSGVPGDRTSGSVDSGLRGSSDRQSTANLSDSTTEAITTPKECSSPSLSPLNAHSFSRSLDSSNLSRSVEQLSSPQMEVEPLRRCKLRGSGGSASSAKSTWGSISRVFARSKHRNKITSPNSQDDANNEIYGRSWSPLTEEGYAEKLRLLREASSIPMERWRAPTVLAWLEISLGMPQYGPRCAQNIKSGKVLLELSDVELEVGLGIQHPMHRKKLRLAIEEHRHPGMVRYPSIGQLGHTWVASEWLPDLGLPQYSENFATNLVDARMLDHLSKKELEKYLGVTRKFHQASIVHGIHLLRMMKYDRQALAVRRHQCENVETDPLVWTNQRFIRWVRNIDLGEYCENLKDSGVHGALVVLEPSFNGDTMATALGVPQSRNMIRRHLAAELEALVLPARAGFEQGYMRTRRSHGGSLGRSLSKIQSRALPPPPPIQERTTTPENRRATSFRGSLSKAFSSSRSSKTNSRCEDNMDRLSPVSAREATSPTWSEDGLLRPESPQSAITLGRKPAHRHRRVKSIGDIDTIRNTTAV